MDGQCCRMAWVVSDEWYDVVFLVSTFPKVVMSILMFH